MPQGRLAGPVARNQRQVDIPQRLLFMPDVALLLEHAQFSAHRRVTGPVRQRLVNLRGGGAALTIHDIHELALAAAEALMGRRFHRSQNAAKAASCFKSSTKERGCQAKKQWGGQSWPRAGFPAGSAARNAAGVLPTVT